MSPDEIAQCLAVCPDGGISLSDWIPLAQTLLWVGLIAGSAFWLKDQIKTLIAAFEHRVRTGSAVKAGPLELGEDLKLLDRVLPSHTPSPPAADDWSKERDAIYQESSGFFLAHVLSPSKEPGQLYDVSIFLVRHKSQEMDDVAYAEFFFGSYWQNEVFRETKKDGLIGLTTTAYGPFLCTCRVKLKNGKVVRLYRYIDFEMGRVFQPKRS